jgi:hypothetical protein
MPKSSPSLQDLFTQSIERALEHFADPAWLGAQSPLAAPYFLGKVLDGYADNEAAIGRGRALRDQLQSAAQQLSLEQQQLLNVSFFQRDPYLNNAGLALQLGYSQATYYRYRANALEALAQVFSQQMLPSLRPEMPHLVVIAGRSHLLANSLQALRKGQTVAVVGASGIGKTALGRALVEQWGPQRAFWFTVRRSLNDQLGSLIFALGYFLRGLGVAHTWRQLVADQGALNIERSLGLLRYDLAELTEPLPLLCIDEVDLLLSERHEHAQMIHLLEELRGLVPLLLIGQQLVIEPQQVYTLTGLTQNELTTLLIQNRISNLPGSEQQQLLQATRGNPALITLFISLWQTGEPATTVLGQLGNTPSVEFLLARLWKRLAEEERTLLMALAVFRSAAPQDAWPAQQVVLEHLLARALVTLDGQGGVAVVSYLRELILERTPIEQKTTFHLAAAHIRAARGEYTAAAYHYLSARQPVWALWLWFTHRTQEIESGHASTALALFRTVALSDLENEEDRRALRILRAELLKIMGAPEEAEAELQANHWPPAHPATPYVQQLQGDLLEMQEGRTEHALEQYRQGLQLLTEMSHQRTVELLTRRGYIYLYRLRDLKQARQEALLARLKVEDFLGNVEEETGNYGLARTHYTAALAIATQLENNRQFLARIHSNLGRLTWRQGDATTAIMHLEEAIRNEQARGNVIGILHDQVNLAGAYIIASRYAAALEQAQAGLKVAEELRHAYLIAGLAGSASEACYYLKRFDEAERYAILSLQQEEESQRPYPLTILGLIQHERQHFGEAEHTLRSAITSAQEIQDKYAEAAAWRALGHSYLNRPCSDSTSGTAQNALEHALQLYADLDLPQEVKEIQILLNPTDS